MIVGYILSRYPLLSETFILREMWELEQQGHRLYLCSLRRTKGKRHPRVAQLQAEVYWPGWLSWRSHSHWLRRRPGAYFGTLAMVLWKNRGDLNLCLGGLAYWGKAVAIARHLERAGVERVHAHFITHPGLAAFIVQRLTGLPYTVTVHAHDIFCHRAMLADKVRAAQAVIAISNFNRTWVERAVPPPRPAVHVVHCGIEWESYAALARSRYAVAAPARAMRLLAVGSLQPYKGHRYLLDACAQLQRDGIGAVCRICGGGEQQRRLEKQITTLGLGTQVSLEGPATEAQVMAALGWAEIFVMPSVRVASGKMEGLPVALMEAMAAGLAVVASGLSGIPELVHDGQDGILVPPGDASALAGALRRLQDRQLRRRLGETASAHVRAGFELAETAARLAEVWGAGLRGEAAA
ncbi:MAG: glycosyltransferase [Terriglobales bacterium]